MNAAIITITNQFHPLCKRRNYHRPYREERHAFEVKRHVRPS